MGAFSRLRYVIAANVNALLEKAEDPEKLLRALIREMEDAGEDARLAVADLLAEQQHLKRVAERQEDEIAEWGERAEKAVATGREDLARAALKAKAERVDELQSARDEQQLLKERIAQLESDMNTLKTKLAEARLKLKEMLRRDTPRTAPADRSPGLSPGERKLRQAMHRFDRLQSQVERLEARVRSYEVGGSVTAPWQESDAPADPLIEEELDALRQKLAGQTGPEPRESEPRNEGEPRAAETPAS